MVGSEEEESDGSELLEMEAGRDLDDWDPELTPLSGVLPIFTSQVSSTCLVWIIHAEKSIRFHLKE